MNKESDLASWHSTPVAFFSGTPAQLETHSFPSGLLKGILGVAHQAGYQDCKQYMIYHLTPLASGVSFLVQSYVAPAMPCWYFLTISDTEILSLRMLALAIEICPAESLTSTRRKWRSHLRSSSLPLAQQLICESWPRSQTSPAPGCWRPGPPGCPQSAVALKSSSPAQNVVIFPLTVVPERHMPLRYTLSSAVSFGCRFAWSLGGKSVGQGGVHYAILRIGLPIQVVTQRPKSLSDLFLCVLYFLQM